MTRVQELKHRIIQCRRLAAVAPDQRTVLTLERVAQSYMQDYRAITGMMPSLPAPWHRPALS